MLKLGLSTLLLLAGLLWQGYSSPASLKHWQGRLKQATFANLLAVVLLQFWCNGLSPDNLPLVAAGALLHVLPLGLSMLLVNRQPQPARWLLAYSSYGGGNRGVLAVLLLAPQLLPDFLVLDLGIFLSLLLCYPLAIPLFSARHLRQPLQLSSFLPAMQTLGILACGISLHHLTPASWQPASLLELSKYSLLVLVSLYLGLSFKRELPAMQHELLAWLVTRGLAVAGTLLTGWLLFPAASFQALLPLAALYFFLPVSSLAPQLTPEPALEGWMSQRVVVSSLLYLLMLTVALLLGSLLHWPPLSRWIHQ